MAFLNEVLLAAAEDAKARGDRNAARACYRDVLKTDPVNAAALAGMALLERGDQHHRETTVSVDHDLPTPLLEGADLEELPPAAPLLRGAALADARSGTPPPPGVILLPAEAIVAPLPPVIRPPRAITHVRPPRPQRKLSDEMKPFPDPYAPPRPHLVAAGRRPPRRFLGSALAVATGVLLLMTSHAI